MFESTRKFIECENSDTNTHGDTNKEKKKNRCLGFCAILCAKQSVFRFLDDFLIFARVLFYFCSVLCHSESEFVFICLFTLDVLSSFLGHYFTHVMLCTNIFIIVFFSYFVFFFQHCEKFFFFSCVNGIVCCSFVSHTFDAKRKKCMIDNFKKEFNKLDVAQFTCLLSNSFQFNWENTIFRNIIMFTILFRAFLFSYFLHLWITLANFKWNFQNYYYFSTFVESIRKM